MEINYWDRPCAASGLTSYRYRTGIDRYAGFVMIGARSHLEALKEASRSLSSRDGAPVIDRLEVWNGAEYVPATIEQ